MPALELIAVVAQRREEYEGHALEPGLHGGEYPKQLEPRHSRHTDIGQHEIRRLLENGGEPVAAIVGCVDLEPAVEQLLTDQIRGVAVILDAKDHPSPLDRCTFSRVHTAERLAPRVLKKDKIFPRRSLQAVYLNRP